MCRSPRLPAATRYLQRVGACFSRSDPDHARNLGDPDLAVTDLAGTGRLRDHVGDLLRVGRVAQDLHAHLRHVVDLILRTSVDLGMSALTTKALHFGDRDAA